MTHKGKKGLIVVTTLLVILSVGAYLWKRNKDKKGGTNDSTANVPDPEIASQIQDLKNQLEEAKKRKDISVIDTLNKKINTLTDLANKKAKEASDKAKEEYQKGVATTFVAGDMVYANQDLVAYFDKQMKNIYKPSFKKGDYIGAYVGKENNFLTKIMRKNSSLVINGSYVNIYVPTSKIIR